MKKENHMIYTSPYLKVMEMKIEQEFMQLSSTVNEDGTGMAYENDWDEETIVGNDDILIKN